MDLNALLSALMTDMRKASDTASIIGEPLKVGKNHMVPLLAVTIGFGTGATDVSGNSTRRGGNIEGGGAGGTMSLEPRAFVVVDEGGIPQLIALKNGKYGVVQPAIELRTTRVEHPKVEAPPDGVAGSLPPKQT